MGAVRALFARGPSRLARSAFGGHGGYNTSAPKRRRSIVIFAGGADIMDYCQDCQDLESGQGAEATVEPCYISRSPCLGLGAG